MSRGSLIINHPLMNRTTFPALYNRHLFQIALALYCFCDSYTVVCVCVCRKPKENRPTESLD